MSCSSKVYLIPLRQGLLLTLELDWQPAGPVTCSLDSAGCTNAYASTPGFLSEFPSVPGI